MTREEVYSSIDTERDFQIMHELADDTHIVAGISLGDTISAIEYNTRKLQDAWYTERQPYPNSMNYVRKIAALCVQMGERFGLPQRELYQ